MIAANPHESLIGHSLEPQHRLSRYYDPTLARFTTMDNILLRPGDTLNANLYAYVAGDPVNASDPSGHLMTLAETVTEFTLSDFLEADAGATVHPIWVQATAIAAIAGIAAGGLVFMQNGSPTTILSQYLLQTQQQIQQTPVAAGQAYQQAVKTAVATGKYTQQQVQNFPTFWVFRSVTPQIFWNDLSAMTGVGTKGGASAPDVLNYAPGMRVPNGRAARAWANSVGITANYPVTSLDEYPFASTAEGGVKPWLRVGPVPVPEQQQQSKDLTSFYAQNTISGARAAFAFLVVLVP